MTKPKLLLVWHEAGNPVYWDRFRALADSFTVEVLGLGRFQGRVFEPPTTAEPFRLDLFDGAFTNHWLSFVSPAMYREIWRRPADLLYIHEEPHAVTSFAAALMKRGRHLIVDSAVINTKGSLGGYNLLERFVYRRADGIFSRNGEVNAILRTRGADPVKLLGNIGNGVSHETFPLQDRAEARRRLALRFPQTRAAMDGARLLLAYAGRIWRPKGIGIFVDLMRAAECNVMVCGETVDPDLVGELTAAGVVVLPRLEIDLLRDFYAAADIFVLPSEPTDGWREQFGRVLTESIFSGTPAIGSRVGAIPSIVGSAATFEPGDLASLISVLARFHSAEARANLLTTQTATVEAEFTWEAIAAKVVSILPRNPEANLVGHS